MKRYVLKTKDDSIARYTELYVEMKALEHGIAFTYATGTTIFYPYANIIFMKIEEVDDDECN